MLLLDDFFNFFTGIYVDYDGADGDQCFDLANAYSRWIGGQRFSGATADLIYNQPGDFYEQIPNTPDGIPQKGDMVVWNWPHVGIATGNNSSTAQFEVLEQNDPASSDCHIKVYLNYNGVIGWLRPKSLPVSPTVPPQPEMPGYLQGLFQAQNLDPSNEGAVRAFWQKAIDFDACNTDKINAQTALSTANNTISNLQFQVAGLTSANKQQSAMLDADAATISELQNTIKNGVSLFTPTSSLGKLCLSLARQFG